MDKDLLTKFKLSCLMRHMNLSEYVIEVIFITPIRKVILKFTNITDIPDMISN